MITCLKVFLLQNYYSDPFPSFNIRLAMDLPFKYFLLQQVMCATQ
jgi:hypothetical protein